MSKKKKNKTPSVRNFVAKHAGEFCKARTHRDRKNDYKRNEKHRPNYKDYGDALVFPFLSLLW